MIDRSQTDWYRDAIIYQVHVKSFFDSNDNGIGDFAGLTSKLDYIRDLGVTAIWLMPFYPSPLRDDGYDIADYRGINPSYGSMQDFKAFIKEAHKRDIRVITELVINHTSDQHPWFQRARRSRPGSASRSYYVWSDTDQKYSGTRIIFLDTEPSNWSWDPVAQSYYWHRFYSHQPDLNFDNPAVLKAVIDVMYSWLDMGVDGLRLDAIPYLVEREGTNNENLPETHAVIKKIRAALDERYPDRMLLAEANQWPEDTAAYFGEGDECHMAFHFPLMPRMYMAIAQEDRHPVTDIMRQTPETPADTQWAIFLRNHDELTLEMVTDKERDYLWSFYAADRRARINLGIRRRLAPLLDNDRRKIELMNSLVLSMPGTPILYYGDEIGMGDNIYLGDRDGVRTPMQWSPDRNGGFSKADPAQLYLPTIQDPVYGFQAVNVEAQQRSPSSLLSWMRRMLAIRRTQHAFGRGTLRFLYPSNRKVLAYVREHENERIVCVANLSRTPQAVELDLSDLKGLTPVEMIGGEAFPPVGDLPYLLTLPAYGFFWFSLQALPVAADRLGPPIPPELFTLVLTGGPESLLRGRERTAFERNAVQRYIAGQRWFAGKKDRITSATLRDFAVMPPSEGADAYLLPIVSVALRSGASHDYFVPLAVHEGREDESLLPYALARVRRGPRTGLLYGATEDPRFAMVAAAAIGSSATVKTSEGGELRFAPTSAYPEDASVAANEVTRFSGEQSNSSIALGSAMVLKLLRRLQPGINPEVEMGRYLTEAAGFAHTPPLFGWIEHAAADGTTTTLAVLQGYVRNQGDAATLAIEGLKRELDTRHIAGATDVAPIAEAAAPFLRVAAMIGRRTGELHAVLAEATDDPAFAPEPMTAEAMAATVERFNAIADEAFAAMRAVAAERPAVAALLARRTDVSALLEELGSVPRDAVRTRIHGDYHLGQVLIAQDDVVIVDFEGEPGQPADVRRTKDTPLRDVAGMLRSFAYAAETALETLRQRFPELGPDATAATAEWRTLAEAAFLDAYWAAAAGSASEASDAAERDRLLRLHLLGRALYEIVYEAGNRPDWIETPVRGALEILDQGKA
ncbi:MAG: maltose alpha-D-glucosyltransferase [Bauldia sp.]|nr:maltose alpha-D-glucosyltransferase [Bauldia sp.]